MFVNAVSVTRKGGVVVVVSLSLPVVVLVSISSHCTVFTIGTFKSQDYGCEVCTLLLFLSTVLSRQMISPNTGPSDSSG